MRPYKNQEVYGFCTDPTNHLESTAVQDLVNVNENYKEEG